MKLHTSLEYFCKLQTIRQRRRNFLNQLYIFWIQRCVGGVIFIVIFPVFYCLFYFIESDITECYFLLFFSIKYISLFYIRIKQIMSFILTFNRFSWRRLTSVSSFVVCKFYFANNAVLFCCFHAITYVRLRSDLKTSICCFERKRIDYPTLTNQGYKINHNEGVCKHFIKNIRKQ